jgi:hypothetical protein
MTLTKCKRCGRVVPGDRKVRAYAYNGEAKIEARIEPLAHLEDMDGWTMAVCEQKAA